MLIASLGTVIIVIVCMYHSSCHITPEGIVIPIINEDVVRFIQSESSNLKFVRECFDFAYSGIRVNESGSKVILTTNEGETIVVNLEAYIHNSLMNYAAQYKPMREKY